jgi:uncharacterized protein
MAFNLFILLASLPGYYEPWGKDADLCRPRTIQERTENHPSLAAQGMEKMIWFHQNIISPADGPRSHFKPSSSGYMLQAIQKHGFIKGYIMGCDRLLRENSDPWIYKTALVDDKIWKIDPPR